MILNPPLASGHKQHEVVNAGLYMDVRKPASHFVRGRNNYHICDNFDFIRYNKQV